MSATRDGLLLAVARAPEDDGVRLVFADWLEENGDELDRAHAELIRLQIERERLPPDGDRRAELHMREEQISQFDICKRLEIPSSVPHGLTRGFPDRMGFSWNNRHKGRLSEDDLAEMAAVAQRLPIRTFAGDLLGCATSTGSADLPSLGYSGLELLARWPVLAQLTALELTSGITLYEDRGDFAPGLRALAKSPYAAELRRLRLGGWQVDREALAAVASSSCLPNLAELELDGENDDGTADALADVLEMLLGTPFAGRLRRLASSWVDVPSAVIRAWLEQPMLSGLAFGVPEGAEGVGPLLGSPGLSRLRQLSVTGEEHGFFVDELPDDDDRRVIPHLAELLASPELARLETLSVRGVALGDDGVRALAGGPAAASLVELDLTLSGLTGEGLRSLRPLLSSGRLRRLAIDYNHLTTADAEEMASWPEFGRLHRLEVGYFNSMGDAGREALEKSPHRHPWLKV